MVTCQICKKEFNHYRVLGSHTTQLHGVSKEEYYKKYINSTIGTCKLCGKYTRFQNLVKGYSRTCGVRCAKLFDSQNPEYRKRISDGTKKAMRREDVKQNHLNAVRRPKSEDTLKKMSLSKKQMFLNNPLIKEKIYTKQRNEKISNHKIEFWKNNSDEKIRVGNIWKQWKERDETGWRNHLLLASKKGFEKIYGGEGDTKLEIKMYNFLEKHNMRYKKQYNLDNKLFDAYLTDYNVLLEFDGEFWHKKTLEECQYGFQIESYHNDILKNEISKNHNIPLLRIRENESPEKILEYLSSIKTI